MQRKEYMLACLHAGARSEFSPVQVQKLFFLLDRNIAADIGGPYFSFSPYLYGPFDKDVYIELGKLAEQGLIERANAGRWHSYRLTDAGEEQAAVAFNSMPNEVREYIERTVWTVKRLSFRQLVMAIYQEYPEMRQNSIFVE